MDCYFTLCYNTYGYSLLFYKVYIRRENAGSWNSGLERSKYYRPILRNSKSPETPRNILKQIKKNPRQRWRLVGPHPAHKGGGAPLGRAPLPHGPPGGSPTSIFSYMKSFDEKKIRRNFSGRDSAATRRNLGRTNLGLQQSCSAGDTSLREGEIITNAPLIGRVSISINIFTSTISSQT